MTRTRWFTIINEYAASPPCRWVLLAAMAVIYVLAYLGYPALPGSGFIRAMTVLRKLATRARKVP